METLAQIHKRAARRHGGAAALEEQLSKPKSRAALRRIADDRWLAAMTRSVFQAGFVWKVIEAKWPGFEEAFLGFEPAKVARLTNARLDKLAQDGRIVRNPVKIRATRENAVFLVGLAKEYGSAARCFADWPPEEIIELWRLLHQGGSRLGGFSGPMCLRQMGVDTPMLTNHVVAALRQQGVVIGKTTSSNKTRQAIQDAFNGWREESGRSLTEISKILACSTDG